MTHREEILADGVEPITEQVCAICENGVEDWEPWQTICKDGYRHLVHSSCCVPVPQEDDAPG